MEIAWYNTDFTEIDGKDKRFSQRSKIKKEKLDQIMKEQKRWS